MKRSNIQLSRADPPSLKWSDLKYVFWHQGGPICRGGDSSLASNPAVENLSIDSLPKNLGVPALFQCPQTPPGMGIGYGIGAMRRKILTKAVLARIPDMIVRDGLTALEIAEKLGCTIGTLRVRCSQKKISLLGARRGQPRPAQQTIRISGAALALSRCLMWKKRSSPRGGTARSDCER